MGRQGRLRADRCEGDVRRSDLSHAKRLGPPGRSVSETPLNIVCLARIWLFDAHRPSQLAGRTGVGSGKSEGLSIAQRSLMVERYGILSSANMLKRGARSNSASTSAVEDQKLASRMNGDEIATATPAAKGHRVIT